jgi:D-glycero-alpha-D-manno-heptose-7-phosphate kinase
MQVTEKGSVRVDLLGGTLDIHPIQLILPNVVTLNLATGLQAWVDLVLDDSLQGIKIISRDYQKEYFFATDEINSIEHEYDDFFKEMRFIILIIKSFGINDKLTVTLSSGSPAGAGLGGSSAMGITLAKALSRFCKLSLTDDEIFKRVQAIECRILNQGVAGYQDYWPALKGGVLAIMPHFSEIQITQLFSPSLKQFLENHLTLVYSGQSRQSGINNWEVYKAFFDGDQTTQKGLAKIAELSMQAYQAILNEDYDKLLNLIAQEGAVRAELFPNIVTPEISSLYRELSGQFSALIGLKMCGAGGGGCFLLLHHALSSEEKQQIFNKIQHNSMSVLEFKVNSPVQ